MCGPCTASYSHSLILESWGVGLQVDVWLPLEAVMEKCWVLWELIVLAQPLMVIAPSPGTPCASHCLLFVLLVISCSMSGLPGA